MRQQAVNGDALKRMEAARSFFLGMDYRLPLSFERIQTGLTQP